MPRFKPYNYDQDAMVVINFREQLQPGTFEHAVHYLIDHKLDLSIFHPNYRNDDTGRVAYDPAILLKALSCDTVPHFTTLAKFVSGHAEEIEALFEQVLLICHEQGLLGNELFAIDGCKMSSNAAKEWSGTFQELSEKRDKLRRLIRHHLREHFARDAAATKIDCFLKTHHPRRGQGKRHQEVKSNITDNESAKMTTGKGTIQGYNGVAAVDKKHQIILDAQAFGEGQEHHTLQPVLEAVEARFKKLGIAEQIYQTGTVVTADTGFANEANMQYLYARGNAKLFFEGRLTDCRSCDFKYRCLRNPASPDSRQGHGRQVSFILATKRPPNYTDWMKHRVDSPRGKEIYSHRMSVVEPVFGNLGTNKGLNRFSLRGKKKVQGQWQLYCLVHNIEKLANYGQLAA